MTIPLKIRRDAPELWQGLVAFARMELGLAAWSEDDLDAVMRKVRAPTADQLLDHIGLVLMWCAAAENSGNDEARATVDLWKHPGLPIEIMVDADRRVSHRLDPDVTVEFGDG